MGQSSQAGQVGFGVQTLKGTPVAATLFSRLRSGGLGGDRSLMVPDPEIGGHRDVTQAYLGPVAFGGDLEFYPRMQMIAQLLYAAFGSKSSNITADPVMVHTITPGNTLPWVTVEEAIGTNFESLRYTDCKVNSLRIEAEATGYVMGSANVIGMGAVSGFTRQPTPNWDDTPMMTGGQVVIEFGGNVLKAKSFFFEVNNNLENDDFVLGSAFLNDITEKRREFKVGLTYRPQDSTLWKAALWGDTGLTGPISGPAYEGDVSIHIETFEEIDTGEPFVLDLTIPHAVIAPFKATPSGDDVLSTDLELTVIRPAVATPAVTATVTNDLNAIT